MWNIPTILIGGWRNAIETAYALKSETYLRYDLKYAVLPGDTGTFADMHPDISVRNNLESDLRRDDYIVICPDDGDQALLKDYISNVHLPSRLCP